MQNSNSPDELILPSGSVMPNVIRKDGVCYERVEDTSLEPDTLTFDAEFSTCVDCESDRSSIVPGSSKGDSSAEQDSSLTRLASSETTLASSDAVQDSSREDRVSSVGTQSSLPDAAKGSSTRGDLISSGIPDDQVSSVVGSDQAALYVPCASSALPAMQDSSAGMVAVYVPCISDSSDSSEKSTTSTGIDDNTSSATHQQSSAFADVSSALRDESSILPEGSSILPEGSSALRDESSILPDGGGLPPQPPVVAGKFYCVDQWDCTGGFPCGTGPNINTNIVVDSGTLISAGGFGSCLPSEAVGSCYTFNSGPHETPQEAVAACV